MKKKSLKSLTLNKKSISNLEERSSLKGGQTMIGGPCPAQTIFNSCDYCPSSVCESFVCPSWWGGQLCPKE
ncbi:hypothetical protein [Kordia sp.]|uniref:hypothetical protein n=1 Tax=Kordia sp. TaxID=1965332 RepID=UPI003D6C2019